MEQRRRKQRRRATSDDAGSSSFQGSIKTSSENGEDSWTGATQTGLEGECDCHDQGRQVTAEKWGDFLKATATKGWSCLPRARKEEKKNLEVKSYRYPQPSKPQGQGLQQGQPIRLGHGGRNIFS